VRAITIGQYTTYYNEPNLINYRINKVAAKTKEHIKRVSNKYIDDTNSTDLKTKPKAKAKPATGASGQ
jgi:predicted Zn-dependent peptidase